MMSKRVLIFPFEKVDGIENRASLNKNIKTENRFCSTIQFIPPKF